LQQLKSTYISAKIITNTCKLVFYICFTATVAMGQLPKFTDSTAALTSTLKAQLNSLGNDNAAKLATYIETSWNSDKITGNQKTHLVALAKAMQAKGYKASPQYLLFFDCLRFGLLSAHTNEAVIDSFLETSLKMLAHSDGKSIANFWEKSRSFFYTGMLYTSPANKLYLQQAQYKFAFVQNQNKVNIDTTTAQQVETILNDGWDDTPSTTAKATPEVAKPVLLAQLAEGPRLEIAEANLAIVMAQDSQIVQKITGSYGFKENLLLGAGGQVGWGMPGLENVYATLGNFAMDVRNPKITSPNATLNYQDKLTEPLVGAFEYLAKRRDAKPRQYPKFVSNRSDVNIKNLGNDIEYIGGFSLVGNKIYSTSLKSRVSTILYKNGDKVLFKTTSNRFEISDSLVRAPIATFTAMIDTDSLYHPAARLELNRKLKELRCFKAEHTRYKNLLIQDSYHGMEINADVLRWHLNDNKIDFYILAGKRVVPAIFESYDNFEAQLYPSLTGTYGFNPMQVLNSYFRSTGTDFVYLAELATFTKKDVNLLKNAYTDMQQQGMAILDADEGLQMTRKGKHYVRTFSGKKDYDNFLIASVFPASDKQNSANASINLEDKNLTINGVNTFSLSDSLNIQITPSDGKIVMHKNRSFTFNGRLISKNFRFRGSNFYLDYENFMVKMNKLDAVTFIPQANMKKGALNEVGGNLKYENGELYLNRPNNKSGREKAPEYPKLVINSGLTVPFSQPERAGGVYDPTKVYFKIPKIAKDSINSKDLEFAGTFHGGGLVPDFDDVLVSMPDNSLGFVHKTNPTEKIPLYGSTSYITCKELKMDNKGLHTEAEFTHLRATFKAKDLIIYPDSLVATGTTGNVTEGSIGQVYYPKVTINDYLLKWKPKQDSLLVHNQNKTGMELYNADTKLDGELNMNSEGMFAKGTVKRPDSEITSNDIKFEQNLILAKHALAKVGQNLASTKPVLMSYDANLEYHTKAGTVKFDLPKSNSLVDTASLYLPYSSYKTSISTAVLDIAKKQVNMSGSVASSVFTSLVPEQEGLSFNASGAMYDLSSMALNISGVPHIDVVDSRLIPAKGAVLIKKDGNMEKFENATLQVDSVNAYHILRKANIKVISKNNYQGDGIYTFTNAKGDSSVIKFSTIDILQNTATAAGSKAPFYTLARANVQEKDKFMVTPKLQYRGEISFKAGDKALILEGAVRPFIEKRKDLNNWLSYKGKNQDGQFVALTKQQLQNETGETLFAGWHYNGSLYTSFLSAKANPDDQDLFLSKGELNEDAQTGHMMVNSDADPNHKFMYDDKKNQIFLEGRFKLFAKNDNINIGGSARILPDSGKYTLNTIVALNFSMPVDIQKAMASKISKANLDATEKPLPAEANKERLIQKVAQLLGSNAAASYRTKSEFGYQPLHTASTALVNGLVLSDVDLLWDQNLMTFHSLGSIGVANIGINDINAQMPAYFEIHKNTDAQDDLALYIEANESLWYFLSYRDNKLGMLSSDPTLNATIALNEIKKEGTKYAFGPVDILEKEIFVENFRKNYKVTAKPKPAIVLDPTPATPKKEEVKEGF
jgi:hypothetical protein